MNNSRRSASNSHRPGRPGATIKDCLIRVGDSYPTIDDFVGRVNDFQGGSICWTPQGGAGGLKRTLSDKIHSGVIPNVKGADGAALGNWA